MNERKMFREKNFGIVDVPANSFAATDNFYVDRSRLKTTEVREWNPTPRGGDVTVRTETASIMDNARRAAGEMSYRGSFKNETDPPQDGDCCFPGSRGRNPLTRKRGDD